MNPSLNALFATDVQASVTRAAEPFDRLIGKPGRPIVLLGAGEVGKNALAVLRAHGIEVPAFADNNPLRWGASHEGLPVLSPLAAAEAYPGAAFVVSIKLSEREFQKEVRRLSGFGAAEVCPLQVLLGKWPEISGWPSQPPEWHLARRDKIEAVHDLLVDEESRRQFLGHMGWRIARNLETLPAGELRDQYFVEGIVSLGDGERFVDGGAFDGDTIRSFLYDRCERFGAIHAFEPDPGSFRSLQAFHGRLPEGIRDRIALHPEALAASEGEAFFKALGNHSSSLGDSGGTRVRCVSLDEALAGEKATFIKLDLEGGESAALDGARRTITRDRPLLAVAIYHNPPDFLDLPLQVRDLCPDYRFHLRTHNAFGLDVILYAVPQERTPCSI